MIEMYSKYDNMHINGMFMPYFVLIIMFYHVKIACYQQAPPSSSFPLFDLHDSVHRVPHVTPIFTDREIKS